jgi:hypothetical protein
LRRRRLSTGSDWAPSQLLTHANGEVLLNEMAMALLAHGNMIEAREGSARPQLIDSLAVLLRRPLLLLHSIGSATPLDWSADADVSLALSRPNRNKTVPVPALVLISRGDVQIPTAGSLESWRRLRSEWQRAGAPAPRWFVQNVAGGVATTLAPDNGIRPLPTGVQDPEELLTFLKYAPNGLEGRVSHRSTLLMCCCMQTETMERQRAVKALRRNGFACNSSDVRTEATLRAAPEKRFGQQYTVEHDATERRFHMWRYRYYSAMLHSRFVASPEGHGRDNSRTWEALALGAIPVLRRTPGSAVDVRKFSEVPVVCVDEWEQLTPRFLEAQWAQLRSRAEQQSNALEARGAHFPFWLHEVTADAVAAVATPEAVKRQLEATVKDATVGHARAQARLDAATKSKKSPSVIRKLGREAGAAEELVDAADADLRGASVNWRHEYHYQDSAVYAALGTAYGGNAYGGHKWRMSYDARDF